jgi:DtxR family Mn-dependent transcriptional regulator
MPEDIYAEVADLPELGSTSESEQMYLITVAQEVEKGVDGPVSVSKIAGDLGVSGPSANEMVKKLAARHLLTYEPYRGVRLTATGRRLANQVLRTRRLWATFLVEHLGFAPFDADTQACQLEHATSPEAANRLASFLGNPEAGPLGHPIPDVEAAGSLVPSVSLGEIPVGTTVEVVSVAAAGRALDFLRAEGIVPGTHLTVVATGATGLLVDLDGEAVHLNGRLSRSIEVRTVGGSGVPA